MGEVGRPAAKQTVESLRHFRPCAFLARRQQVANLRLDPLYALLRGSGSQIPTAGLEKPFRSQGVAQEVEALRASIPHRGFRLVERQPELRHYRPRPRQSLLRACAAEDDEIVGVIDDMRAERFSASGQSPMLQKTV